MFENRYYTLVRMDSTGKVKAAMFGVSDRMLVSRSGRPYLEEFLPAHFRLCNSPKEYDWAVHCPMCGKKMRCINSATQTHTLYCCDPCYRVSQRKPI